MENYFRNSGMFELINKWKIHLGIIMLVAGGLGVLFSSAMFITPKYTSHAVLYPANITPMSEESETEQMLEVIQSQDIRFKVFDAFNLADHYEIPEGDAFFVSKLNKNFESNVTFRQTENEAVQINVMDKDPEIACAMVDSIISFYNEKVLTLNREKSAEYAIVFKEHMTRKQAEIDSLGEIVDKYRKENNMLDYGIQTKEYTRAIANGKSLAETRSTLENWRNLGGDFLRTDSLLWNAMYDYHQVQIEYDIFIRDASKEITYAHVVTKPYPADKKSYPTRWIFVFFSMIGALFASLVILVFIDKARISGKKGE